MKILKTLRLLAISALAFSFAPLALADSIDPTSYSDTLAVGESVTIAKTVTVTESLSTGILDVMFLMDTTGSMGGEIAAAKAAASTILTDLSGFGDLASGAAYFNDDNCSGGCAAGTPIETYTGIYAALSTNDASTQAGINTYQANVPGGGYDGPEEGFLGITETTNNTPWRPGSSRFIVMFGDNTDGGDTPFAGDSFAEAAAAMAVNNITLIGVSYGSSFTTAYSAAATGSGGTMNAGTTTPAALAALIKDAVTASFSTYSSVCLDTSAAPAGVTTTSAPVCHVGSFDRSIERTFDFDVTFTGVAPGDYAFPIHATVDGGIVATESDRICVAAAGATDCASVPEPGSLGLLGLGMLMLGVRRYKLKVARA